MVAVVAGLAVITGKWTVSPLIVLGLFYFVRGLLLRKAKVVLDQRGLLVNTGGLKDQFTAWHDVDAVSVDPPGGSRIMRIRRRDGGEVELPELSEVDRARVLEARPR